MQVATNVRPCFVGRANMLIAQRPCSRAAARARNFCEFDAPEAHPEREVTIVTIGIHPFAVGTADGAEALRRVLEILRIRNWSG
jgi:hypothetical protein